MAKDIAVVDLLKDLETQVSFSDQVVIVGTSNGMPVIATDLVAVDRATLALVMAALRQSVRVPSGEGAGQ